MGTRESSCGTPFRDRGRFLQEDRRNRPAAPRELALRILGPMVAQACALRAELGIDGADLVRSLQQSLADPTFGFGLDGQSDRTEST